MNYVVSGMPNALSAACRPVDGVHGLAIRLRHLRAPRGAIEMKEELIIQREAGRHLRDLVQQVNLYGLLRSHINIHKSQISYRIYSNIAVFIQLVNSINLS